VPIKYLIGDVTHPQVPGPKIILHSCNDQGAWGRGVVLAISNRWSEPERAYRSWFQSKVNWKPGAVQFVQVEPEIWIANMIGQHGLRSKANPKPAQLSAFESGFATVAETATKLGASIHMPYIGTGLGGESWTNVVRLVDKVFEGLEVFVYELK